MVERLRRIFSRFEKLNAVFLAFSYFPFMIEALPWCEHALVIVDAKAQLFQRLLRNEPSVV